MPVWVNQVTDRDIGLTNPRHHRPRQSLLPTIGKFRWHVPLIRQPPLEEAWLAAEIVNGLGYRPDEGRGRRCGGRRPMIQLRRYVLTFQSPPKPRSHDDGQDWALRRHFSLEAAAQPRSAGSPSSHAVVVAQAAGTLSGSEASNRSRWCKPIRNAAPSSNFSNSTYFCCTAYVAIDPIPT
jgi:hypothetical protein